METSANYAIAARVVALDVSYKREKESIIICHGAHSFLI